MSWIREITVDEADGELAGVYRDLIEKRGKLSDIFRAQSLNPGAMAAHLELYLELMFAESGLTRAEREAVGVVVSAQNECGYCVGHNAEALRRYVDDDETLAMLVSADGLETLEPRLSNIVRYAEKLTSAPEAMTESDLAELRAVGLDDRDILDLALIAAYHNFVNRVALGLGVASGSDDVGGYIDAGQHRP